MSKSKGGEHDTHCPVCGAKFQLSGVNEKEIYKRLKDDFDISSNFVFICNECDTASVVERTEDKGISLRVLTLEDDGPDAFMKAEKARNENQRIRSYVSAAATKLFKELVGSPAFEKAIVKVIHSSVESILESKIGKHREEILKLVKSAQKLNETCSKYTSGLCALFDDLFDLAPQIKERIKAKQEGQE